MASDDSSPRGPRATRISLALLTLAVVCLLENTAAQETTTAPGTAAPTPFSTLGETTDPCNPIINQVNTCITGLANPTDCDNCAVDIMGESIALHFQDCNAYQTAVCDGLANCPCEGCSGLWVEFANCQWSHSVATSDCVFTCPGIGDGGGSTGDGESAVTPAPVPAAAAGGGDTVPAPTMPPAAVVMTSSPTRPPIVVNCDSVVAAANACVAANHETDGCANCVESIKADVLSGPSAALPSWHCNRIINGMCEEIDGCDCDEACDAELLAEFTCELAKIGVDDCTLDCTGVPLVVPTSSPTGAPTRPDGTRGDDGQDGDGGDGDGGNGSGSGSSNGGSGGDGDGDGSGSDGSGSGGDSDGSGGTGGDSSDPTSEGSRHSSTILPMFAILSVLRYMLIM